MYNRAVVVGRLTADPELKQTPGGISVTSFSLAVDRPFKGQDGEKQTDFLDIVCWRQLAEFVCRYFSKGRPMLVDGTIQVRQYTDKNGQNRRAWEIVADNVRFVESKGTEKANTGATDPSSMDDFEEVDDSGDLPF